MPSSAFHTTRPPGSRRPWRLAILVALLLTIARPAAAGSVFDPAKVGPPRSDAPAELYRPAGPGPFPAVVVLHGRDGIGPHYRLWARRLRAWGYAALMIDSFRPRGYRSVCNRGRLVPPEDQAADALAAGAWLAAQRFVRPGRVGVIGFSHGGWAVLKAVLGRHAEGPPFAAAVAFYPACARPAAPLATDTLILIGDADDWTPARFCLAWRSQADAAGHAVDLTIYPGALHGFDSPLPPHRFAGHRVGGSPAAAAAAIAATRGFLAARLQRP